MHKRSVRFSILLVILTLSLGFGVSFVAPKPVRADALGDFITRLSLGDFIRGLFNGLFGGTAGDDPYVCEFTNLGDCTPNCTGGSCTSNGCSGGTYKCVPRPTATTVPAPSCSTNGSWRCSGSNRQQCVDFKWVTQSTCACASACSASSSYCNNTLCAAPTATPVLNNVCSDLGGTCMTGRCTVPGSGIAQPLGGFIDCPLSQNKYCCREAPPTPTPGCSMNACGAGSCPSGQGCVLCDNTKYRCGPLPTNTPRPTATSTVRPTATSVPNLTPTVTVGPGTPSPTPAPTNTPVPYPTQPPGPPVATVTPTTPVGAPCYYNVKLVNQDNGSVLPSALQQGITETGGCRTQGVRELVPSFFTQPSQATNRPEWPCTDATYVGQSCTQGIVTGQFICMGGPQHEIKGCYNRTSDAYQRVSITVLSPTPTVTPPAGATATVTPTQPPVATPTPAYNSFDAWFTIFRSYVDGPSGGIPTTLTHLEDWRNNIPVPAPTRP